MFDWLLDLVELDLLKFFEISTLDLEDLSEKLELKLEMSDKFYILIAF